jgi:hypothetical protein
MLVANDSLLLKRIQKGSRLSKLCGDKIYEQQPKGEDSVEVIMWGRREELVVRIRYGGDVGSHLLIVASHVYF